MRKLGKKLVSVFLAVAVAVTFIPVFGTQMASADTVSGTLLDEGELHGLKVRIRPTGSFKPLAVNDDGNGSQNCVHLYYQGKSSQFYLKKADTDSYYINFYQHYYDATPKTTGDCRLDLEDDGGYDKEGQIIHVVSGNSTAENKRWQFIRQDDGSYYIRNKKTKKYWTLKDLDKDPDGKFENKTKLVQSSTPLKWDIEIVSKDNTQFQDKVQYDSRNFQYNGQTVSSNNWMSALPDDLKITDISIPGTHDVGSCYLSKNQGGLSTQRYFIDEMLNAGVRHLDLRTGLDDSDIVRIIHSDAHALNHDGEELSLEETMEWLIAFLDKNPGETLILQPKMDKQGGKCDYLTYKKLREYAVGKGKYIWAGDHVPTLGEVRGKILVLSRLNTDNDYTDFNYNMPESNKQWALDLDHWNASGGAESEDRAAAHTASGVDYDVWVQDNYKHKADDKKDYIKKTLYGNKGDGYTNGTQYHYDQSKMIGRDAWVLNYTSASHKSDVVWENFTPYDLAKEIQQWMLDRSDDYNRLSERIISSDTFTGILAFDFMDGLLSTFIYKTNFHRDYITVQGVDVGGEEVAGPLILQIGENDQPKKILSATTKRILEGQFNNVKYEIIPSDDGDYLTKYKATTQEGINNVADEFYNNVTSGNVPPNPFVHLRTSITEVGFDVDMPKCGTTISGDDPQGSVEVRDITGCEVQSAYITESDDSEAAFAGPVEGGEKVPLLIKLAPKWGYSLDNSCTAKSSTANVNYAGVSGGVITVKAEALIPHDAEAKEAKAATCTENGVKAHYQCKNQNCNKYLLEKKAPGSDKAVLVEVEEDEITGDPALGHEWNYQWEETWDETIAPGEDSEGLETRTCKRDASHTETRKIPATGHIVHSMTHVNEKPATCSEAGNKEYYVCSGCGRCFADEEGSQELTPWEIVIPQTRHDWEQPAEFTTSSIGDTYYMTGSMKCSNDASHVISETVPAVTEITPATCETDGFIDWTGHFTNQTFGTHRMLTPLPAPGHAWNYSSDEAWDVTKKATCSETGEETRICSRCNKKETKEIPIDPKAHDTYLEIDETTDTATCEESGRALQYEVCSICEEVVKTKRINTAPAGHSWGKPVYKWSEDMSEATAIRTCTRSGCGEEESETVKTTNRIMEKDSDGTVTAIKYDAQFENEAFDTQERVVKLISIKGAKVVLSATAYVYNGKVRKPAIKKIGGRTLKAGTDYTVKWSKASPKNVGAYTVTITGKGGYTGVTKATYKINPKGTSLKTLTKAKKAITVKWKKQSAKMSTSRITGYQIQLATNKKFTKNKKTVTVKGYSKTSKKVTKLKGGKKYYVKIRTYKTVGGKKFYSSWSKVKTVKTKK